MGKNIAATVLLFLCIHCATSQGLDLDITKAINPQNPRSGFWKGASASTFYISGAVPLSLLVTGLIKDDASLKKKSFEILGSIALEIALSEAMKITINRQRPGEKHPGVIFPYKNLKSQSFPSGHASLAFATAASLSIQYRKWYVTIPAYLWASSVGYSRIYLGVHYASDVAAGAAVGIGSAYLAHWLNRRLFTPHHRQTLRPADSQRTVN
jgi:membrane-associated phospholipid phosphatase